MTPAPAAKSRPARSSKPKAAKPAPRTAANGARPSAFDNLADALDAAQRAARAVRKDLGKGAHDVRRDLGKGTRDLARDLETMIKLTRRDLAHLASAVRGDVEDATHAGASAPAKRRRPARKAAA